MTHSVLDTTLVAGRPHGITEDYVNVVGEIMYPKQTFGPYGFNAEVGRVSVLFVPPGP